MLALRITYPIVQMAIVYGGRGCAVKVHEGAEQVAREEAPSTESIQLGVLNSVSLAEAVPGPDCTVESIVTVDISAFHLR